MKLNMGCGLNKKEGYTNVDKSAACGPDVELDLEVFPWPFKANEAEEVIFNHSLEHMGESTDVFLGILKELYRICKPRAKIFIFVPHPRHDDFLGDPTHVRVITPQLLSLFSKKLNHKWGDNGGANTPLALYLDVDFEITRAHQVVEEDYLSLFREEKISEHDLTTMIKERNNVVSEYQITLEVIK